MSRRMTIEERIEKRRGRMLGHFGNGVVWAPKHVLRMEPARAREIYTLGRTWEFLRRALPLNQRVYVYETEPVRAITGAVMFSEAVATPRGEILAAVRKFSNKRIDSPGPKAKRLLEAFAKSHETVWAHHVVCIAMLGRPIRAGEEDARGLWLDVPANPIEQPSVSFREHDCFFRMLDEFRDDSASFWIWDDPAEVAAKYAEIRAERSWAIRAGEKGGAR